LLAGGQTKIGIHPVVMENAFATLTREDAHALVVQGSLSIKPVVDPASSTGCRPLRHRAPLRILEA